MNIFILNETRTITNNSVLAGGDENINKNNNSSKNIAVMMSMSMSVSYSQEDFFCVFYARKLVVKVI